MMGCMGGVVEQGRTALAAAGEGAAVGILLLLQPALWLLLVAPRHPLALQPRRRKALPCTASLSLYLWPASVVKGCAPLMVRAPRRPPSLLSMASLLLGQRERRSLRMSFPSQMSQKLHHELKYEITFFANSWTKDCLFLEI
jgi:hypothetical protein